MNRLKAILDAMHNFIIPNEEIKEKAHQRAVICADCKFNTSNFCTQCKCFIPLKVLSSVDKCPKNKW